MTGPLGTVRLEGAVLRLGSRRVPLRSGALHYWRLDPDRWSDALRGLASLGLPIVETYAPWSVHEIERGRFDFGRLDRRRDLGRFLDLAAELGLLAFVRPGPHVNAELTWFGLPERVLHDAACQARSPRQNPVLLPWPPRMFPVPSHASSAFLREAGAWYDAVATVLAPRLYPAGNVVLVQVDNEAAFYFRNGAYDQDYHPEAVALYRQFLLERYGSLEQIGAAHRRRYASLDDVVPPSRFDATGPDALAEHLDWAAFAEHLVATSLDRLCARLDRAGVRGVPRVHNVALGDGGLPIHVPTLARHVDLVGFDYYHTAREYRTVKRRTLYLCGTLGTAYAPELGVGAPPWFTPLTHDDSFFTALVACAFGLRGLNLYMAVDRDRWYGAALDAYGGARRDSASWRSLLAALDALRFERLERPAEVGLVVPPEYRRLSRVTHTLGGVLSAAALEALGGTPVDGCRRQTLGFAQPIQIAWWERLERLAEALTRLGIPYVYVDAGASPAQLRKRRLLLVPSYEFMAPASWDALVEAASAGSTVVWGPHTPHLDDAMRRRPFPVPERGWCAPAETDAQAGALVEELARRFELGPPFGIEPAPCECSLHTDERGPRALFVLNPSPRPVCATLRLPGPTVLHDALGDVRLEGSDRIELSLSARECRLFRVERHPNAAQSRQAPSRRAAA
ncbi:MAG: beta-galactosidase [Myxococcota bacterium]|nr:beta-galactosidase [Myxococcota bacterium]MDW8360947.1 beta-galactosidase [Myxococcales bacterium]